MPDLMKNHILSFEPDLGNKLKQNDPKYKENSRGLIQNKKLSQPYPSATRQLPYSLIVNSNETSLFTKLEFIETV